MQVEVFRTDVADAERAQWLAAQIERTLGNCKVNFDLSDCDRILRVVFEGQVASALVIDLLKDAGCTAEVLPDTLELI